MQVSLLGQHEGGQKKQRERAKEAGPPMREECELGLGLGLGRGIDTVMGTLDRTTQATGQHCRGIDTIMLITIAKTTRTEQLRNTVAVTIAVTVIFMLMLHLHVYTQLHSQLHSPVHVYAHSDRTAMVMVIVSVMVTFWQGQG